METGQVQEAFYLALGPCSIWLTQARHEAVMLGQIQHPGVPTVMTLAIRISINNDRLGIIVENLPGYTAQALEQGVVAGNECGRLLIAGKLHPTPTAVAKGRRKGIKRAAAPAKHHEIALHLASRRGLETHNRIGCWPWPMRLHEGLHATQLALIAVCLELSQQRRRSDLIRFGGLHALNNVRVKRLQLRGPRFTRFITRSVGRGEVARYGVAGNAQASRDLAQR